MSLKDDLLTRVRDGAAKLKKLDDDRLSVRTQFLADCLAASNIRVTQQELADETHFSRQRISQFLKEARDGE